MIEKKYLLQELNCANCANKIESKIRQLSVVNEVSLNFVTKQINVKVKNETNLIELEKKIKSIVKEIEGSVDVCEVLNKKVEIYDINGLDYANYTDEIDHQLNQINGLIDISVNLSTNKLTYTLKAGFQNEELLPKIKTIINNIVPGVTITKEKVISDKENNQKIIIRLIIGSLIFINIFFIDKSNAFYMPMFILSYLIIGFDIVYRALKNLINGRVFDENFLMSIATIGAIAIGEYPEAVAVMLFYQVGELFQTMALSRSRRSIKKLMSIKPDVANLKINGEIKVVDVASVKIGDYIVIKPGERIPLDGTIVEGVSSIDMKALTGESLPVNVKKDDTVLSGSINLNGLIVVLVNKLANESTVAKILELVENAASKKAPTENFISKFARIYTPVITISAVLLAILPPLLIEGTTFSEWIYRAAIFLVISCPCALVVSIPLSFFGGIGSASRNGVLVKGGNYLEALNNLEIVVFDKTGTLTEGSFVVTKITPYEIEKEELLHIAATVESFSNHPIALSVVKAYNKKIDQSSISDVLEITGLGIKAKFNNKDILIGNSRLMEDNNISFKNANDLGSILYIAIEDRYAGYIVVSDQIKKDSKLTINQLKKLGIKTIMLTGDKLEIAQVISEEIGIDEVYAELLPADKLQKVEDFLLHKSKKGKLCFIGDGINDTPVLARADIGIAMGGLGADAAIEVSDVVIMTDETSKIISAVKIAKKTRKIVWQNIIFALGIKLTFLILGAFGIATMWEAVFSDVGVALLAILNAMRVLNYQKNL